LRTDRRGLTPERFDADEDLYAPGAREEVDEIRIPHQLCIALAGEGHRDALLDHRFEQRSHVAILIEVVRCKHHQTDAGVSRGAERMQGRLDRLTAHTLAGDLHD
jgi:hypothetical protein